MYSGASFGSRILSAVRNPEASASRRFLMYYSYICNSAVAWVSASRIVNVPLYTRPPRTQAVAGAASIECLRMRTNLV